MRAAGRTLHFDRRLPIVLLSWLPRNSEIKAEISAAPRTPQVSRASLERRPNSFQLRREAVGPGENTMSFYGYHAEWNLGSPGGWDYARMAQRLGARAWEQIASLSGLKIDLDFNHPAFYPVEGFKDLLLRAEKRR